MGLGFSINKPARKNPEGSPGNDQGPFTLGPPWVLRRPAANLTRGPHLGLQVCLTAPEGTCAFPFFLTFFSSKHFFITNYILINVLSKLIQYILINIQHMQLVFKISVKDPLPSSGVHVDYFLR